MTPGAAGHRHDHDGHPLHIQPANADASEAPCAGPYFAIEPWAEGAGWRPASLLVCDPAVLWERVAHARTVIAGRAGIEPAEVAERVAASIPGP